MPSRGDQVSSVLHGFPVLGVEVWLEIAKVTAILLSSEH